MQRRTTCRMRDTSRRFPLFPHTARHILWSAHAKKPNRQRINHKNAGLHAEIWIGQKSDVLVVDQRAILKNGKKVA